MRKESKITESSVRIFPVSGGRKVGSFLLDFLSIITGFILFYFIIIYTVFVPGFGYADNNSYINDVETKLGLNIQQGLPYQNYESVVKHFYFDVFPNEVENFFDKYYVSDLSLTHIYNVQVLSLPLEPTVDVHENDLFTYVQNPDGSYNSDILGVIVENNGGEYFMRSLSDHYFNEIKELKSLLDAFDQKYSNARSQNLLYEAYSRVISFAISVSIFYIIIPIINKNSETLFERIIGVVHVDRKSGLVCPKLKMLLRCLIYYLIPLLIVFVSSNFRFYVFAIFYIFISVILALTSEDHKDIADRILKITPIDKRDSLIFKSDKERQKYLTSKEYQIIEDQEYLDKLSKINELSSLQKEEKE